MDLRWLFCWRDNERKVGKWEILGYHGNDEWGNLTNWWLIADILIICNSFFIFSNDSDQMDDKNISTGVIYIDIINYLINQIDNYQMKVDSFLISDISSNTKKLIADQDHPTYKLRSQLYKILEMIQKQKNLIVNSNRM